MILETSEQQRYCIDLTSTKRHQSTYEKHKNISFVKHYTTTPYGPYASTNKSRTNSFLKLFNKFKSVFMTMSAIHIKSVTAVLRWIWEGRNLKENNTIKLCLKRQVPIDPIALPFSIRYGLNMDLFFLKHNWDHSPHRPPGCNTATILQKNILFICSIQETSIKLSNH